MVFVNAMQYTKVAEEEHLERTFDAGKGSFETFNVIHPHEERPETQTDEYRRKRKRLYIYIALGVLFGLLLLALGGFLGMRTHYDASEARIAGAGVLETVDQATAAAVSETSSTS